MNPHSQVVFHNLGVFYAEAHRTADAVRALEEAIRLAPGSPKPYLTLARVFDRAGDRGKAREAFERASRAIEDVVAGSRPDEARELLREARALDPSDPNWSRLEARLKERTDASDG
jgi:predicted Zn-dependent protease